MLLLGVNARTLPLFTQLTELNLKKAITGSILRPARKAKQMVLHCSLAAAVTSYPERPDLVQALGSALIEHGRWHEGLPLMRAAHLVSTDVQQFNLQLLLRATGFSPRARRRPTVGNDAQPHTRTAVERPHKDRSPERCLRSLPVAVAHPPWPLPGTVAAQPQPATGGGGWHQPRAIHDPRSRPERLV